jgi:hypothetical protein
MPPHGNTLAMNVKSWKMLWLPSLDATNCKYLLTNVMWLHKVKALGLIWWSRPITYKDLRISKPHIGLDYPHFCPLVQCLKGEWDWMNCSCGGRTRSKTLISKWSLVSQSKPISALDICLTSRSLVSRLVPPFLAIRYSLSTPNEDGGLKPLDLENEQFELKKKRDQPWNQAPQS